MIKLVTISLIVLVIILMLVVVNRHWLLVQFLSLAPIPFYIDRKDEGSNVEWIDDYHTVEWLDARTVAISEPTYYQQNIYYLILGDERAILFDAGPGLRPILPIVESLTDLPITFVPSHFHYDHLGDGLPFDHIAIVDLPHLSKREHDGQLTLKWQEHLGAAEGYETPTFTVGEWLKPGDLIDLGNRTISVVFTPGHTNDAISLYDPRAEFLFTGDFIYQGDLLAMLPHSSLGEYEQGSDNVLVTITDSTKIYGGHRIGPPGVPVLGKNDVSALKETIIGVREGTIKSSGLYPVTYPVTESLDLIAERSFLQNWEITYPELTLKH